MNKKIIYSLSCFLLFIILSILIVFDKTKGFDTFIYNIVTFKMNDILTIINKIFTFLGSTLFIVLLSVFFFFFFLIKKEKNSSFIVAAVIIISTVFNNVVKLIIRRERPKVLALVVEKSFSFPSGHTMASVSLYGILLYMVIKSNLSKNQKILISTLLVLIATLVALSRIYLGAHFASDIIGGALLSLALLFLEISYIDKKKLL